MLKNLTYKILNIICEGVFTTAEIFLTITLSEYGSSQSRLDYNSVKIRQSLEKISKEIYDETFGKIEERRKFYKLISKLKSEGIIKKENNKWVMTATGLKKMKLLKILFSKKLPQEEYPKETEDSVKIFTFDIPEKECKKRVWLRQRLQDIDFRMLQKSVWIGKTKLPIKFMESLRNLNILRYIEILIVTKSGTLQEFKSK